MRHQMTDSFQAHKDVMQFLSQARAMRSALVNRLYCAVCAVSMCVLSTGSLPSSNSSESHMVCMKGRCADFQTIQIELKKTEDILMQHTAETDDNSFANDPIQNLCPSIC